MNILYIPAFIKYPFKNTGAALTGRELRKPCVAI